MLCTWWFFYDKDYERSVVFIDNILYECVLYLKLLILIKKEKKTMHQVILFENIIKKNCM